MNSMNDYQFKRTGPKDSLTASRSQKAENEHHNPSLFQLKDPIILFNFDERYLE
jgi:hypothetical protein